MMTEADFQKNVIELAHMLGWTVAHFRPARTKHGWRTPVSADGKGFPDLVLAHPDRGVIFAELKSQSGKVSADQQKWIDLTGAHVWRPSDLQDIGQILGLAYR